MNDPRLFSPTPPTAIPAELCHYTTCAALLGILESRTLYATHIRYLNDSQEFIGAVEVFNRVAESLTPKLRAEEAAILRKGSELIRQRRTDMRRTSSH